MANSESPRVQWISLWHNVADVWANGFGAAFLVGAVVGLWAFLSRWNAFLLPAVVMQDEGPQTVLTALAHFVGRVDTHYALLRQLRRVPW